MNREKNKTTRILLVVLTIAAWLSISNHCVLGLLAAPRITVSNELQPLSHRQDADATQSGCPMHSAHRQPVPAKQKDCGDDLPCCKTITALAAKPAKSINQVAVALYRPFAFPSISLLMPPQSLSFSLRRLLDTGPPGSLTFAELILQRSILAHAPPSLA